MQARKQRQRVQQQLAARIGNKFQVLIIVGGIFNWATGSSGRAATSNGLSDASLAESSRDIPEEARWQASVCCPHCLY